MGRSSSPCCQTSLAVCHGRMTAVPNGIMWRFRSGTTWSEAPDRYGPSTTCYDRFVRCHKAGVCCWRRFQLLKSVNWLWSSLPACAFTAMSYRPDADWRAGRRCRRTEGADRHSPLAPTLLGEKRLRQQRHPRGAICSECLASTLDQSNRKHPFGFWP